MFRETDKQIDRPTDQQTDRQTDRQIDRMADRQALVTSIMNFIQSFIFPRGGRKTVFRKQDLINPIVDNSNRFDRSNLKTISASNI